MPAGTHTEKCVRSFPKIPQHTTRFLRVLHLHHEARRSLLHMCSAVTRREGGRPALRDKQSRAKLRWEGRDRPQSSSHSMDGLTVFMKPTRHCVRRALPKKCCSQMDSLCRNYLLQSSFLVDYATVSQHRLNSLALSLLPACLAQGESDVGQGEDSVLSLTSSEIQSRYQELT